MLRCASTLLIYKSGLRPDANKQNRIPMKKHIELICRCGNVDENQMSFKQSLHHTFINVYCKRCIQCIKQIPVKGNEWRVEVKKQDKLF